MQQISLSTAAQKILAGDVPQPPEHMIFVGDGDFRAIAAEWLHYFVEYGELKPDASVLDVGSGIGRIAAGLTTYLDPASGRYLGLEPVAAAVDWCRSNYADRYPNFTFRHVDVHNELYNPDGAHPAETYRFPVKDNSITFAILTSVFTHMYEGEIANYLRELDRVLTPSGRLFATAYLHEGKAPQPVVSAGHLTFDTRGSDNWYRWHSGTLPPLAAVCYSEEYFFTMASKHLGRPFQILKGRWRGGEGPWFQDLILA